MSVVAIRYKNFMAFRDTDWIELRPICLLFGRNSSGKSAIIRGLRLLKQSLRIEEASAVKDKNALRFAVEGQLDLGDFRSVLHQHTESANDDEELEAQKITFAFRIELRDLTTRLWKRIRPIRPIDEMEVSQLPSYIELNLEFGYSNTIDAVKLIGVHLDCPSSIEPDSPRVVFVSAVRAGELVQLSYPDQGGSYTTIWSDRWYWTSDCGIGEQPERESTGVNIDWAEVELIRHFGFLPHLQHKNILRATENLDEVATDYALVEFALRSISVEISTFLQNIQHLGPMRPKPERVYMLNRFEMEHWRAQGLGAWLEFVITPSDTSDLLGKSDEQTASISGRSNQLIKSADEKYELLDSTIQKDAKETSPKSFQAQMDEWIKILNLGHEVQVEPNPMKNRLGYTPQVYIVKENGKRDNLADVGYGASQVLPIIATCLRAQPGSLIIIEQPELHLHPAAQTRLCDLFLGMTHANSRFLIETHSEHLILGFQKRIERQVAQAHDLFVAYVSRAGSVSVLHFLRLDQEGDFIDEWPDGFFEERYNVIFDLEDNSERVSGLEKAQF